MRNASWSERGRENQSHTQKNNTNNIRSRSLKKGKEFCCLRCQVSLSSSNTHRTQRKSEMEEQAVLVCKSSRGQAFSRHARQSRVCVLHCSCFRHAATTYTTTGENRHTYKHKTEREAGQREKLIGLWLGVHTL